MKQFKSIAPQSHELAGDAIAIKWSADYRWVSIEHQGMIHILEAIHIEIEYIDIPSVLDQPSIPSIPSITIHSRHLNLIYEGNPAKILFYILNKYLFHGESLTWNKLSYLFQDDRGPQSHGTEVV